MWSGVEWSGVVLGLVVADWGVVWGLVVVWLCKIAGNFGGHLGAKNTDPG